MKKLFLLILTMAMLLSIPVYADEIDLDVLSNDELVLLRSQVQAELNSRGFDTDSMIYPGVYVTGQDIKAGQYICLCVDAKYNMNIIIFETEDTYDAYFKTTRSTMGEEFRAIEMNAKSYQQIYEGDTAVINLRDGMVLMIEYGTGRLDINKSTWVP